MTTKARIIRGIVESVTQDSRGQAIASIRFGLINTNGDPFVDGWIEIGGKPIKQGEMFGIQWGDESQVWLAGSVVDIVL